MRFSYGAALCFIAVCWSGIGATSGGRFHLQAFTNTTSSSTVRSSTTSTKVHSTISTMIISTGMTSTGKTSIKKTSTRMTSSSITSNRTTSTRKASTRTTSTKKTNSSNTTVAACQPSLIHNSTSSCVSYCPAANATEFSFAPDATTTMTAFITIYGNMTFMPSSLPRIVTNVTLPPQPCPKTGRDLKCIGCLLITPQTTITSLVTSKTEVSTVLITVSPRYGVGGEPSKSSVAPAVHPNVAPPQYPTADPTPTTISAQNQSPPGQGSLQATHGLSQTGQDASPNAQNQGGENQISSVQEDALNEDPSSPIATVNGVPVRISQNAVLIGTQVVGADGGSAELTVDGQVFSVNPSQIIASETTVERLNPAASDGAAQFTTIGDSPEVIIGSSTFKFGLEPSPRTTVIDGQAISIGPDGVGPATPTAQPESNPISILGAAGIQITTAVSGSSEIIFGGTTLIFGAGTPPQTTVINGQTISIGPNGIGIVGLTASALLNSATSRVLSIGGITFTEIVGPSSTIAIFGGQTFTVGAGGLGVVTPTSVTRQIGTVSGTSTASPTRNAAARQLKNGHSGRIVAFFALWVLGVWFTY